MKRIAMLFFVTIMLHGLLFAQHHETDYVPETDPLVLKKLELGSIQPVGYCGIMVVMSRRSWLVPAV